MNSSSPWRQIFVAVLVLSTICVDSVSARKLGEESCESQCQDTTRFKDLDYFDGAEILDGATMLSRLKGARAAWVESTLKKDYGAKTYLDIFEPEEMVLDEATNTSSKQRVSVGRQRILADPNTLHKSKSAEEPVDEAGPAWDRMIRKFQMKLLQIRIGILEERLNVKPICLEECAAKESEGQRQRNLKFKPTNGLYTKFTWATGGHSASAGHGNMFRESYTANMDRALTPLFSKIGLDFVAKNYAMGGTDSADEVALCMNSIFGRDVDAISWDYGMTDGHDLWKMTMYAYKAAGISKVTDNGSQPGNLQHRPAWFAFHQGAGNNLVVKSMQELGMTTLAHNQDYMKARVIAALPDMMGKTDKEIANTPAYVQYFKCNGQVENGEPGCEDHKFNRTLCTARKARTSWHPGWKYHALMGNLVAMTLLDVMEDALQGLIDIEAAEGASEGDTIDATKKRLQKQLKELDQAEKKDYENIFSSPLPEALMPHLEKWWNEKKQEHMKDMDIESFLKEPSFCHSALLPAEIRFQGFLTENFTHTGTILDQRYEEVNQRADLDSSERPAKRTQREPAEYKDPRPEKDGQMMLVTGGGRQECEEYLNLDYKDYFVVTSMEGWRSLTLPNDSEKKHYTEFDTKKNKGWIVVCLTRCDWGKCAGGDMHNYFGWTRPRARKGVEPPTDEELKPFGKLEMTINGERVAEASDMHTCYALKNKKGHVWEPNADGKYEIKARMKGATEFSEMRFSAFILI